MLDDLQAIVAGLNPVPVIYAFACRINRGSLLDNLPQSAGKQLPAVCADVKQVEGQSNDPVDRLENSELQSCDCPLARERSVTFLGLC